MDGGGDTSAIVCRLQATREELVNQLWETARRVTGAEAWAQLRELARLKADIEALDFAMTLASGGAPTGSQP